MMSLSLGAVTLEEYYRALTSDHWVWNGGQIMDLDHNRLSTFTNDLWEGQVNIDANGEVTRNATLKILDPTGMYGLDSRSPASGAIFYDRMISLTYTVWAPFMANPVTCDIFTGPIVSLDRDGVFINMTCHGKEQLAKSAIWRAKTYKKGTKRMDMLKDLMINISGETKYDLPLGALDRNLTKDRAMAKETEIWKEAFDLATRHRYQLFYDGRGVLRLRRKSTTPVFTFRSGNGGTLLAEPKASYDDSEFRNVVRVKAGDSGGTTKPIDRWKYAPDNHPLSPRNLGRNGKKRYLLENIESADGVDTAAEADKLAQDTLDEKLAQGVTTTAETLVIPHLDPDDWVAVQTPEYYNTFQLKQMSIPVGIAGDSTLGYHKRVTKRELKRVG